MTKPRFELPTKPETLSRALSAYEQVAIARRNALRVGWTHDLAYIKGIRKFRIQWGTGEVQISHRDQYSGELQLRYEQTLQKRQREIGRLMQTDTRPATRPHAIGLDGLRKASTGYALLDYLTTHHNPEEVKHRFVEDLVDFGTAGLALWVYEAFGLGSVAGIENIPPWELLPLPIDPTRLYDVCGHCRDRWVPYEWLKGRDGLRFPRQKDNLRILRVSPGERIPNDSDPEVWLGGGAGGASMPGRLVNGRQKEKGDDYYSEWVYLKEYWIEGEKDRVGRYIVKAGDAILLDADLTGEKTGNRPPVMPIEVGRYYSTGYYGRSFNSPLIPLNKQVEKMLANVFQNIIDLDLYGFRILPTTAGITKASLANMGRNRWLFADYDYSMPHAKPTQLLPQNMGDMPVHAVQLGNGLIDSLSRESEMFSGKAPGRIDNSRSLGILYETMSVPTIPVTASMANVYRRIYSALLDEAPNLLRDKQSIPLVTLDDAMPGLQLDPDSREIMLDHEKLPGPDDMEIDIRERMPRFQERQKAELDEAVKNGRMDWVDYIIECLRKNIDIPLGNRGIVENIRTQWLENLILFGDGETPGTITTNPMIDNHKIQKRIIEDFLARPETRFAAPAVRDKLMAHLDYHTQNLRSWPDQLPDPENFGMLPAQVQQGLMAGAPQGPMQAA